MKWCHGNCTLSKQAGLSVVGVGMLLTVTNVRSQIWDQNGITNYGRMVQQQMQDAEAQEHYRQQQEEQEEVLRQEALAHKDYWGAIAADRSPQRARSVPSVYAPTEARARNVALSACGLPTCKVIITYMNSCGAIAVNKDNYLGWEINSNPDAARREALRSCNAGAEPGSEWVIPPQKESV